MSTPDKPSQPLTRRQLREMRMTGQNPVITPADVTAAGAAAHVPAPEEPSATPEEQAPPAVRETAPADARDEPSPAASEADGREAAPAAEAAALEAAAQESSAPQAPPKASELPQEFGGRPLTRRQVRERERRGAGLTGEQPLPAAGDAGSDAGVATGIPPRERAEDSLAADRAAADRAVKAERVAESETSVVYEVVDEPAPSRDGTTGAAPDELVAEPTVPAATDAQDDAVPAAEDKHAEAPVQTVFVAEVADVAEDAVQEKAADLPDRPVVDPGFGSALFDADKRAGSAPGSFEDILSQSSDSSGSAAAGSTLVLTQDPGPIPLSAPITATGELLLTSSHTLPDGFGSRGHVEGATDGKDVDAVLIDRELPLSSSPTPIAASAAVSTSKSPSEVIRPPAPEKNQKLTLILGITAAALGVALIGVVIVAFTTGVL
ncbi:hypothetical protein [Microbacterium album]|uniref:Uncharacterized protein n=1 Tax=Microbacterium album TaxID=2053191 RepID=A0A917IEY0_9MICO|nr:hypothetical protein [Microbacterium album]GGH38806.1 hypothetical protein GCM10010921_09620 [Microbacterium album]